MNLYFIKRFKVTNNIDNKINRERNEKKNLYSYCINVVLKSLKLLMNKS